MKNITKIEIDLLPGPNPKYPWLVYMRGAAYNSMRRFRSILDALAWTINEVAKE